MRRRGNRTGRALHSTSLHWSPCLLPKDATTKEEARGEHQAAGHLPVEPSCCPLKLGFLLLVVVVVVMIILVVVLVQLNAFFNVQLS